MASKWPVVPLDQITETPITYGVVQPGPVDNLGVPFIRGGDIVGGRVLTGQLRTITQQVSKQYGRTILRGGEILVSLVGNPGQVAIAPTSLLGANIARQVGLVRLKDGVDNRFIAYFLSSPKGQEALGAQTMGSVQQVINLRDLRTVEVPLPSLPEQRAIARILGTLDDKIELNRRMNATLEAIARTLFQSWFVNFDPVRAKSEGHEPEGMDAETAALFPDSFEDSELGPIPAGWTAGFIGDVCLAIFSGGTPDTRKPEYWGGEHRWFSSGETRSRFITDTEKRITQAGVENSSTRRARPSDILIASAGQGFTRGQTSYCAIETYINQSVVAVRANDSLCHPLWLYFNLARRYEKMRAISDSHSSRGSLTTKLVASLPICLPPRPAIDSFVALVAPMVDTIVENLKETAILSDLRDTLLPKLISGQMRIRVDK